jgi:hypothetical protein
MVLFSNPVDYGADFDFEFDPIPAPQQGRDEV